MGHQLAAMLSIYTFRSGGVKVAVISALIALYLVASTAGLDSMRPLAGALLVLVAAAVAVRFIRDVRSSNRRRRVVGFKIAAGEDDGKAELEEFLTLADAEMHRHAVSISLHATPGEGGRPKLECVIEFEPSSRTAMRALIGQTFGVGRSTIVRELTSPSFLERVLIKLQSSQEPDADQERTFDYDRDLPRLPHSEAYQLRFPSQAGAGLLSLNDSASALSSVLPTLSSAAQIPGAVAVIRFDGMAVSNRHKHDLRERMRETRGEGGVPVGFNRRKLLVFVAHLGAALITLGGTLIISVPYYALKVRAWYHRLLAGGRRSAGADDRQREVLDAMSKKAAQRLYTGCLYAGVIATEPNPEIAAAAEALASQLATASAHDRTRGALEAVRLKDARKALTGRMPRRMDPNLLLTGSEVAALVRPPDTTAAGMFELDRQAVPNLPLDSRLKTPGPGLVSLGVAAPGTKDQPVALDPADFEGLSAVYAEPGMGKSTLLAQLNAGLMLARKRVFVIDPAGRDLGDRILKRIEDEDPAYLENEKLIGINFEPGASTVYFNPMLVRGESDWRPATLRTDAVIRQTVGDIWSSSAKRAAAFHDILKRALMRVNRDHYAWAVANDVDPETVPYTNIAHMPLAMSDPMIQRALIRLSAASDDDRSEFEDLWTSKKPDEQRDYFGPMGWRYNATLAEPAIARLLSSPFNRLDYRRWISESYSVLLGFDPEDKDLALTLLAVQFDEAVSSAIRLAVDLKAKGKNKAEAIFITVDEAQALAQVSVDRAARSITEARKFGVNLIPSTQYPKQYLNQAPKRDLYDAMGSAANLICGKLAPSHTDNDLARALDPSGKSVRPETLAEIDAYHFFVKTQIKDGNGQRESVDVFAVKPTNDPQRDASAAVNRVWQRGADLVARPDAVADEERSREFRKASLMTALERIHGPQAVAAATFDVAAIDDIDSDLD